MLMLGKKTKTRRLNLKLPIRVAFVGEPNPTFYNTN